MSDNHEIKVRKDGKDNSRKIASYFTDEEVKALISQAKESALQGDKNLQRFLLEQLFGKSPYTAADDTDKKNKQKFGVIFLPERE